MITGNEAASLIKIILILVIIGAVVGLKVAH
jgi:quaternary ammonium compound-resistance protein SugE